jgi:hypothetical protein
MGVSFFVFVHSGEAAPREAVANEQPPYAPVSPRIIGGTAVPQNQGQLRSVPLPDRFIHPRYKPFLASYDAAVLKLSRPVTGIRPIKLATARQNNLENPGHILRAAGWG